MSYRVGDTIICRIKEDKVVKSGEDYDREEILEIIYVGSDDHYLVFVPSDVWIHDAFTMTERNLKNYSLDKKFVGDTVYLIAEAEIKKARSKSTGLCCSKCKEHFPYAEKVGDDGFNCWNCRNYPSYR